MTGGISYWNVIPAGLIAVFYAVAGQQPYADTSYSAGNSYEPQSYYQQPQPQYQQYQSQPPQYGTDGPYGYAATFAPSTPSYSTPIPYQPAPQPYQPQQSFGPTSNSAGSPTPTSNSYAAVCDFPTGAGQRRLLGRLRLAQAAGPSQPVRVNGYISGLNPGKHGIHIHMYGDFSNGCTSAGEHYNPLLVNHGAPQDDELHRHVGDLGNVDADANGVAYLDVVNPFVSLAEGGRHPVGGRSVVVHEMTDDLGRGGNEESRKTGNSGARVGCCAIVYIDPSRT